MTSVSFMIPIPAPPAASRAPGSRRDDARGVHHVARRHPVRSPRAHAGDVARRQREASRRASRRSGASCPSRRAASAAPPPSWSSISSTLERVDHHDRAVLQLLRQRRAQRAALDLLRQLVVVAARLRPEHRAALAPQRVADLADARAAGALLPPRLLAAAADERAVLGRVRAAPLRGVLAARPTPRSGRSSRARRTRRRSARARRPSRCCC